MSLMGYTEEDIKDMIESIELARGCVEYPALQPNKSPVVVRKNLNLAKDFLEGIIMEGRI